VCPNDQIITFSKKCLFECAVRHENCFVFFFFKGFSMGGVSGFPGLLIALMISVCVSFFAIIRTHKNE